jgi:hypothetical protein
MAQSHAATRIHSQGEIEMNLRDPVVASTAVPAAAASPADDTQPRAGGLIEFFTYELIDLAPGDGITRYLNFTNNKTSVNITLFTDPEYANPGEFSSASGSDTSATYLTTSDNAARATAELGFEESNTVTGANSASSVSMTKREFVVSPHTRVVFTARGTAFVSIFDGGSGYADALISGEVRNDSGEGAISFSARLFSTGGMARRQLIAAFETGDRAASGFVQLQGLAKSSVASTGSCPG